MDDRLTRLEAQLEQLAARVSAFEPRLAALEARVPTAAALDGRGAPSAEESDRGPQLARLWKSDLATIVAAVGRTLVILAGAYLLRALADSNVLEAGPGALLGLAFSLLWIVMADRVGARGHSFHATFHGVAFVLIAMPLLFEATTRFDFLNPATAAASLMGCAAVALAVAARRHLLGLAWVTTLGTLGTTVALMLLTGEAGPFALFLVLLGVATLWLGYVLDWTFLRWPVAFVLDLTLVILSGRAVTAGAYDTPGMALAVQILLLVAYLGSFAARTLFLNRNVIPFEVVQSVAAIMAGLGGAAYVTHKTGVGTVLLGLATLALAAGCYGVAVAFVERRQGRHRNFFFYTSAGLVFALVGAALVLPTATLALACGVLGLAAAWAGRLSERATFHAHGAVYLAAAFAVSGLHAHVLYGLGVPAVPAHAASAAALGVLGLCVVSIWALGPVGAADAPASATRVPRLVVLVLGLGGVLGIAGVWLPSALGGGANLPPHPGLVATLRTALLVAAVVALAWAGGTRGFVEGMWLVYPLLALTGLKFLLEDFRAGRPATLFLSFALYGLALIAGPWLCLRRGGARDAQSPERSERIGK